MTCRDLVAFLDEYLAGQLASPRRGEFEEHLHACPECLAYLDSYAASIKLGRAAFASLDAEVPEQVPEELLRAVLAARGK